MMGWLLADECESVLALFAPTPSCVRLVAIEQTVSAMVSLINLRREVSKNASNETLLYQMGVHFKR